MAVNAPKKIGKYEVLDVIGKGGMGIVYRAKDPFLDRVVAIKMMTISYADYPDLLQRFYREAKSTANLTHPNIVTVYELGEHEGSPYMAMQYLEGASLESVIRSQQPLTLLQKIDIIIQVCHGLAYAHQREIIHRDIKPGNIMVLKDGTVKIVDFGIARMGDTNFTRTGQFMGSLNYMSLEQLNEKLQVDQRTDVYSTGVVLYQFLTGILPFEAESTGATLMRIFNEAPPPFSKYLSAFPPELETITLKALAKDRDQRYSSADEFALDLTQLQDRLKEQAISVHLQRAEELLQRNEQFEAHDELLEILKIDKQNSRAVTLLRSLRKQIEKEQSTERARQFKEQAEEAFRREEFDPALGYIEQAIGLDATNADLQQLRVDIQAAKAEAEHLRQVLQRAETAHRAGNLDTAKQALEEVLALRPNDTRVKSLYRMIQKEVEERVKQKRLENLMEAARKEISNRRYTAAFDILKEAEKVDPDAPELRALLEKFNTARDQEQRRRELEQITRQTEQALNSDDHQAALNLVTEALRKFPNDPSLLKLKELAESQKQVAETKAFVRERIGAAREILNAGNATGALKVLEDALLQAPGNPHLESLVSLARERLTRNRDEQAKARCIQEANTALGRKSYAEAIQLLEAGQLRFANSTDIDNLLRFAREQQSRETRQQEVDNSVRRAQELLRTQEYDRAIELLESILARVPDDDLRIVLEEARQRRDDLNHEIAAAIAKGEQFLAEGAPAKALEFLQSQPSAYRRSEQFRELLQTASHQPTAPEPELPVPPPEQEWEAPPPSSTMVWDRSAPPVMDPPAPPVLTSPPVPQSELLPRPPQRPTTVRPPARQQQLMIATIAAAVLVVGIVAAIILWPSKSAGTLSVRTDVTGVEVFVDNKSQGTVGPDRQLKISLPEGRHQVRVQKPGNFHPLAQTVEIVMGKDTPVLFDLLATGTLLVQVNVDDVDVFVDSDPKRVTSGKKLQITLPPGDHEIRVEKQKYNQLPSKRVHVDKDQATTLPFTLTPLESTASFLEIKSKPGAQVSIDQTSRGTVGDTGVLRVQVGPSNHLIELTLDGYNPWAESRSVDAGQTLPVIADLIPRTTPKQQTAAPTINFTATPDTVAQGQSATLYWQTTNATDINILGVGSNLQASGSQQVKPTQTTTYTLTAKGAGGTSTKQAVVKVPPLPTVSFTANPSTIQQGQSTTLTWSTQNATQVSIPALAGAGLSGSVTVTPDKTASFTIEARGPGGIASSMATVTVQPAAGGPPSRGDANGIDNAVARLEDAYASESLDEMLKAWPSMDKQQQSGVLDLFKRASALEVTYQCADPSITGNTASVNCTQTTTETRGTKRQRPQPAQIVMGLKKTGSIWVVDSVRGR